MLSKGMVSVTFRGLSADEIIALAVKGGLTAIEWGGDVHVPHGDTATAGLVAKKCAEAKLKIASYGSYYKAGQGQSFNAVLETAAALGAPNIRIWAGIKGSANIAPDEYASVVSDIQNVCILAGEKNMTVSLEFHGGTLTDTPQSAVKLIGDVGQSNIRLYWQPNQHVSFDENMEALKAVLPYLSNIHVFCWEGSVRYPLGHGAKEWSEYIRAARRAEGSHYLLMEFVPDDSREAFLRDALTLDGLLDEDILAAIRRFNLEIPYSEDISPLARPVPVGDSGVTLKNAITVHPMEGFDGNADGSPGELTFRRYERFARSGASLIWLEATAVQEDARTSSRQLWIRKENLDSFKRLADIIHEHTGGVPAILQLTHSGRFSKPFDIPKPVISYHNPIMNRSFNIPPDYPVVTDDYLDRLEDSYSAAAKLAYEAGFDGVDIKACHRYLLSELLSAFTREGKYGGSYENRTRLFKNIIKRVRSEFPERSFLIGSRFGLYDAIDYPYGFGVDKNDYTKPDLTETIRLLREMYELGVRIVNITMGTPYFNPHVNRPYSRGGYLPPEHPLSGVERLIKYSGIVSRELPEMTFIGTGYTYLGKYAAGAAAGALKEGLISAVGFGRMAFAYEGYAGDMINGCFDEKKACITCGKCTEIMRAHGTTGCPVRDSAVYAPIYRKYCIKGDLAGAQDAKK